MYRYKVATAQMAVPIAAGAATRHSVSTGLGTSDHAQKLNIKKVTMQSNQPYTHDVLFYSTDGYHSITQTSNKFSGMFKISNVASRNVTLQGNTYFVGDPASATHYIASYNCDIPYEDEDATGEIHFALVNRSGTAMSGTTDKWIMKFTFEPQTGIS